MVLCYLALGSNLGLPARQLRCAIQKLRKLPGIHVVKVASFYTSSAWGRKVQPAFCNTVVAIQTNLPPHTLLARCLYLEKSQGRLRSVKWGARTLDIDILLYDQKIINHPNLSIPHPRLLERDFVLTPLLEIAPEACLPDGQSIAKLSQHITISTTIKKLHSTKAS
ncbi:MAG: 2-amino-4-hydroxy-6-hydroxymethyldihydropteridine diphosphokinase [Legionella sp.]|nr:2-amino-4-hydroxy-6-hydroxymethyldihydropteridine diphosphokinase [Legionella sp.]